MTLSAKQLEVRDFILAYQAEHGEPPAYKVIMAAFQFRSFNSVYKVLRRLEKTGELRKQYVARTEPFTAKGAEGAKEKPFTTEATKEHREQQ
jgi:SOS-response transcriptional repressor LexA